MALTLEDGDRMIKAGIAKAKEMNIHMTLAVVDGGGHLLAFGRMETCIWASATVAQGKAVAASGFGRPSGVLPADSPVMQSILAKVPGGMLAAQGAVPIVQDGLVVGAIGGSGGTGQEDEDCAKAGLAAL